MLRRRGWFRSLRSVTVRSHYLPSAWNVSWNDAPDIPSATSAINAVARAIVAASARGVYTAVLPVNGRAEKESNRAGGHVM